MSYGDPSSNPNPYQSSTPGYMPPQPQGSSTLSIISLVCGILGILTGCCCGLLGLPIPLAAIICGGIALAQPNSQGKGMAIGGVVLGVLGFVVAIVMVIIAVSNPQLIQDLQKMQK